MSGGKFDESKNSGSPKFDENGWCSDMSLAPTKGYTEILVRQVNEETGDCVYDSYDAYCIPDIIEEDDGWVNTHWKLIKPPVNTK